MENLVEQAIQKGWREPIFMDCYAQLINFLTDSQKSFISKKNVRNIVLEKIKAEFLFTFKDLRFFLQEVNESVLV